MAIASTFTHVLIVVFLNSYGPRPAIQFQEFVNKERCEAAAQQIRQLWQASNDLRMLNGAVCLPK